MVSKLFANEEEFRSLSSGLLDVVRKCSLRFAYIHSAQFGILILFTLG